MKKDIVKCFITFPINIGMIIGTIIIFISITELGAFLYIAIKYHTNENYGYQLIWIGWYCFQLIIGIAILYGIFNFYQSNKES